VPFDKHILTNSDLYTLLQTGDQRAQFHKIMLSASIVLALSFLLSAAKFWLATAVV
jgi:hypothetical protein